VRGAKEITCSDLLIGLTENHGVDSHFLLLKGRADELRVALEIPPRPGGPLPKLTQDRVLDCGVKKALVHAAREADEDRAYAIDDEFLLRGILCNGDKAAEALQAIGYTLASVRTQGSAERKRLSGRRLRLQMWMKRHVFQIVIALAGVAALLYLIYQGHQGVQ